MSRLASGKKVEVNQKDMLKLTSKNYENLPEVKKKKEEERKKEELKKRLLISRNLNKYKKETNYI